MKILHLITHFQRGGIEKWLLTMLKHVPRDSYQMDFCCKGQHTGSLAPLAIREGARVFHCPLGPWQIGFLWKLRSIVHSHNYDIIHNHLGAYSGLPLLVSRNLGIPTITSFHNTHFAPQTWTRRPLLRQLRSIYSRFNVKYALQHSNIITGCSQSVLDSLSGYEMADKSRFRLLYYGTDVPELPDTAAREAFRASFGWEPDTHLLVHVGRFFEQKNHRGLIKIFRDVQRVLPQARLLLVGDGALRKEIEHLVISKNMSPYVRFLGARDDVPDLLRHCDIFVMPSRFEGFGLAALEASAAGLPVVGSLTSGLIEAVDNGQTGLLFPPDKLDDMANGIIKLLQTPDLARRLGMQGRQRVQERFSIEVSASQLTSLYDECYRTS